MTSVTLGYKNTERRLILPRSDGQEVRISNLGLERDRDCGWVERGGGAF